MFDRVSCLRTFNSIFRYERYLRELLFSAITARRLSSASAADISKSTSLMFFDMLSESISFSSAPHYVTSATDVVSI